ncbi:hypothetical protein J27TS8_10140 [Robertmurraya siralis]|uniref:Group-specific protein n=1 Tax=Robertmurraya siralis TaxID=77777 RepID=A0A919WFZ9_9BACI|nr:hypothetical protein [Robertmurraya siralis]PAE22574.1 hypothetical protein CHH80_01015 [Bacillus sp. 7504-2]GIN61021.1 hypothetical protein J27TS8_10140 [Robertmurraya siralis]
MVRKILSLVVLLTLFIFSLQVNAKAIQIEIFHINKGKVIKEEPSTDHIQREVVTILEGITDVYRGFEPIPQKGYMVKIPLENAVEVKNKWLNTSVNEVILIFPEYENPHLMVFGAENSHYFFHFDTSVDEILSELGLRFKGQRKE